MSYFVGLDVSLDETAICVVDDIGEIPRLRREEKLGPAAIARHLGLGRARVYCSLGKYAGTNGGNDADHA